MAALYRSDGTPDPTSRTHLPGSSPALAVQSGSFTICAKQASRQHGLSKPTEIQLRRANEFLMTANFMKNCGASPAPGSGVFSGTAGTQYTAASRSRDRCPLHATVISRAPKTHQSHHAQGLCLRDTGRFVFKIRATFPHSHEGSCRGRRGNRSGRLAGHLSESLLLNLQCLGSLAQVALLFAQLLLQHRQV